MPRKYLIFAAMVVLTSSTLAKSQTPDPKPYADIKKCIEGRWGESGGGPVWQFTPDLTWDLNTRKLNGFYELDATRSDKAVIIHFYKSSASIATTWRGTIIWSDGLSIEKTEDVETYEGDCKTMPLSSNAGFWLHRIPKDPNERTGESPVFDPYTAPRNTAPPAATAAPAGSGHPNVVIRFNRVPPEGRSPCTGSMEVGVQNYENRKLTVKVHEDSTVDTARTSSDFLVALGPQEFHVFGCSQSVNMSHIFKNQYSIVW